MSSKKPEQVQLKHNLFRLIDSGLPENISMAIALIKGNRSLSQAAKDRYYPLMRILDERLGGGFDLLYKVAGLRREAKSTPFMRAFIEHYMDLGETEIAKFALWQHPDAVNEIRTIGLLHLFVSMEPDEEMIAAQIILPDDPRPLSIPNPCKMLGDVQYLELQQKQHWEAFIPHLHAMPDLDNLVLSGCQLTTLPDELAILENLMTLRVDQNQLTDLPAGIARIPWLTMMDLSANRLQTLPEWISEMPRLNFLDVSNNALQQLPDTLLSSSRIKELMVSGNKIKVLPIPPAQNLQLKSIRLSHNPLAAFPTAIFQFPNLELLHMNECGLTELPAAIGELKHLKELRLWNNHILELPAEIGECKALEILDLRGCLMAQLPGSIQQLQNLKELLLNRKMIPENSPFSQRLSEWLPNCTVS
jgi:Leucine-rich repeat (LRR) protein